MKSFIHKINKFLLSKYPLIWNTKLLWMLTIALFLHLIFFILGILALTNVEHLHEYDAKSIFFKNGTVYISIIISILLIVIWCIQLFKNNAFKSFYPTSKLKLFKEFFFYVIILFSITTFFLSYNFGLKTYISITYDDEKIENEITMANRAAIFFSDELSRYTINQKKYPKPFDSLYCEVFTGSLDVAEIADEYLPEPKAKANDSLPHLKFLDTKYFFYTLSPREGNASDEYIDAFRGFIFFENIKNNKRNYYFKDSIVDVSHFIETSRPSYYNYSSTFYLSKKERQGLKSYDEYSNYYYTASSDYNGKPFSELKTQSNKTSYQLLKRDNPDEIKQILNDFLALCKTYEIKNNLNIETWFNLIYNPSKFEVKALIRNEPKVDYLYDSPEINTPLQKFQNNIITDYYIKHDNLRNLFSNVEDIKESTPYKESIHFFMWLAMFLATIILMFRTTGLKPLLFSIIVSGVLSLSVGLITSLFAFTSGFQNDITEYFAIYLTLFLSTIILLVPLLFRNKIRKSIVAICINMSIAGFVLYLLLIIITISMHQDKACPNRFNPLNECFNLLTDVGILWSFILFITNLVFLYFYMGIIKTWKGLPES